MPEVAYGLPRKEKFIDRRPLSAGKSAVLTVIRRLPTKARLTILTNFLHFGPQEYCAWGICVICGVALPDLRLARTVT